MKIKAIKSQQKSHILQSDRPDSATCTGLKKRSTNKKSHTLLNLVNWRELLGDEKITTRLSLKYAKLSVKLYYDHYQGNL